MSTNLDATSLSRATGSTTATAEKWLPFLVAAMEKFGINTQLRQASFLSQVGHESGGLSVVEENLNYSSAALLSVFKKYFPSVDDANKYARKPKDIANVVYANRMGNGSVESGEGYLYRGRGPIQITGKNNYAAASKDLGLDLVKNPDLVLEPKVGSLVAAWFWDKNNLNQWADKGDNKSVSKIINAGNTKVADSAVHGLDHRMSLYKAGLIALA